MAATYGTVVFCVVRLAKWFANVLGMMAAAHPLHLAAFDAFRLFASLHPSIDPHGFLAQLASDSGNVSLVG